MILAVACAVGDPDREAYLEGLRAADYPAAWSACGRIEAADLRGDCQTAVAERFLHFDDCGGIDEGRWRDECRFVASETLGRRGDLVGALDACKGSAYAAQCDDHVLGLLANAHLASDVATLASAYATVKPHLTGTRGEVQMWQHYFRNRVARGLPVSVDGCPRGPCRAAADREVSATIREMQLRDPAFCTKPPPAPAWAADAGVLEFVRKQHDRGCGGLEAPPPRQ